MYLTVSVKGQFESLFAFAGPVGPGEKELISHMCSSTEVGGDYSCWLDAGRYDELIIPVLAYLRIKH